MSPTNPNRIRRARKATLAGLAGLVGVSAAVALPALAAERDDAGSDLVVTAPTEEERARQALAEATPEQLSYLAWISMDDGQRAFVQFASATEQERNYIMFFSAPEDVRAAFADALTPKPPAPAPKPKSTPAPQRSSGGSAPAPAPAVSDGSVWDRLAACESGGNWSANTGNGFYGGLQFSLSTWRSLGGSGYPHEASRSEQISRAQALQARAGWGQWPSCSSKLGLR